MAIAVRLTISNILHSTAYVSMHSDMHAPQHYVLLPQSTAPIIIVHASNISSAQGPPDAAYKLNS